MEVPASSADRRWSISSISSTPTDRASFVQERQNLTHHKQDSSQLDDGTSQSGVDNNVDNNVATNKTPASTTVIQKNTSSNDPMVATKAKPLSKRKESTLRYRKSSICLLACYLPLIIVPWTITCVLAVRPLNGKSYISQWGGLDARGILAIVGWLSFVRILNSIAGVLTIPIVSAIIAQAAVVYAQRRKERQKLNMRQLFALADKGWSDITILWNSWGPNRKGTSSRFLWLAAFFVSLCAIQQPIQSALVAYEQITVITCLDIPLYGCDKFALPTTIGLDPEPGDMTLIPQDLVVQEVASKMATVSEMDVQPYLWPDNPYDEEDLPDAFVNPVSRRSFFWYEHDGLSGHGNVSYFATSVENGTTTGVLRQHAMRFNSSAECSAIARTDFPALCPGPRAFNASFQNDYVQIRACAPGEYGVYPWTLSRNRQDINEEMFLDVSGSPSDSNIVHNFTIHCTASTTRGYFELGNYQNNYSYGGLVDRWPEPEDMEYNYNDYLPLSSGWGKPSESDNTSALENNLPFIFQQSPDQFDTSDLKVSGPLMTSMIAMFGNHSFFHLAANASNSTFPSVLWQIYQKDQTPLTRLSLVELDNYGAESHFDPGSGPSDDVELADYLGGWAYSIFNDTNFAEYALETGMFFANRALMEITVRVEGTSDARPIFTSPGLTIIKPVTRAAQVSIVSVLLLAQILGLVWLMWYIYRVPSWSHSLDSVAVARIGRAMGEHDLPSIGTVTEQDLDLLNKVDALIGVAAQEMKPLAVGGQTVAEAEAAETHDDGQATASDVEQGAETTSWLTPSPEEIKLRLGGPGLITKQPVSKKIKTGSSQAQMNRS